MKNLIIGLVASASYLKYTQAYSNITFFSDDKCVDALGEKNGPDDGTCTQFPDVAINFGSFRVTSLDQTCAVTVYGSDIAYCSSANLFLAQFGDCMTNTTVGQFSIDCQSYTTAISTEPQIYAGEATATEDSSDKGLSGGAKAGIGIGAACGALILVAGLVFFTIRNNRRKRKQMQFNVAEADSSAAAPPYSELPPHHEKKAPAELPPQHMIPVEVPGDHSWPLRELEGSAIQTELEASIHPASDVKSVSKGDSEISPAPTEVKGTVRSADSTLSPMTPEK